MSTGRLKWKCPGCGNVYSVRTVTGLTLCPDCKRKTATAATEKNDASPTADAIDIIADSTGTAEPAEPSDVPLKPFLDLAAEAPPVLSSKRPPSLDNQLRWLLISAKAILVVTIVSAVIEIMACYGWLIHVISTPEELTKWQGIPVALRVLIPFTPVVIAFLIILSGGTVFLLLRAFVELLRTATEIEANTRRDRD